MGTTTEEEYLKEIITIQLKEEFRKYWVGYIYTIKWGL